MMKRMGNWVSGAGKIYVEYSVLALAIMLPMLRPGYIFALDLVFTPKLRFPGGVDNSYLFVAGMHYLNTLIPSQILEKLLLGIILVLSGVGMHLLVRHGLRAKGTLWGAYFGGILYMINPFTYSRFMYGHILLLLAYALTPFFLLAWWKLLQQPSWRKSLIVASLAVAISILSIHSIFFMFLLVVVSGIIKAISLRHQPRELVRLVRYSALVLVVVLVASSYWLVPTIRGTTPSAQLISHLDSRHTVGFHTTADKTFGLPFNVAALYGFWGDREGRYVVPKTIDPAWFVLAGMIWTLVAVGVLAGWRQRQRLMVVTLVIVGLIAWLLAMGEAFRPTTGLFRFMVEHVPLFRGYREPQKFVALLALAYAFLGGLGVQAIIERLKKSQTTRSSGFGRHVLKLAPVAMLVVPILYTPLMLWGFTRQLTTVDYPADWYSLNRQLNADPGTFKVLFLPWHQYMSFHFTNNRIIANPAQPFFDKPIIQGDNIEFGDIFHQTQTPSSRIIENRVLRHHFEITNAGAELAPLGIKYVILAKEFDQSRYRFLARQTDLKLIGETPDYRLYQNQAWPAGGRP